LVEGQRAPKGLTISVVDRSDASVKPEKLTPRLVWRDPGALAALPGVQAALSAAIAKPKLIEGPGPSSGSARVEVTFPEVILSEAERPALADLLKEAGPGGVVGPWRLPILVRVPGAIDTEFLLGIQPRQDSFKGQLAIDFGTVNTTITVYNGSVIRQLPL